MQAIVETLFDAVYLVTVITLGIIMILKSAGRRQYWLFGIMAVVLGLGDSFHLIPRALALCTTGLENYTVALGAGKLITSVTMTVFYILLYYVWRNRYHITGKNGITAAVYLLSVLRIVLCLCRKTGGCAQIPLLHGEFTATFPLRCLACLLSYCFFRKRDGSTTLLSSTCG